MTKLFDKVYQGLIFHPDSPKSPPLANLGIILTQFILIITLKPIFLLMIFFTLLIENWLFQNINGQFIVLKTIFPLLIFLGVITILFAGINQALIVILRLLIGAVGFSLFFAITNPSDLARSLERLHFPSKLAIIPSLSLMLVPRVAKDAEETFNALLLRGELRGKFYSWLPRILAIYIASVLYRSEFLSQSLFFRGFGLKNRSHYRNVIWRPKDILRMLIWLTISLIFLNINSQI